MNQTSRTYFVYWKTEGSDHAHCGFGVETFEAAQQAATAFIEQLSNRNPELPPIIEVGIRIDTTQFLPEMVRQSRSQSTMRPGRIDR